MSSHADLFAYTLRVLPGCAAIGVCLACGAAEGLPTEEAEVEPLVVQQSIHGELSAVESALLIAPNFRYYTPEIAWLAEPGQRVAKGEPVVELDRSELERGIEDAQASLDSALKKLEHLATRRRLELDEARASLSRAELQLSLAEMERTDSETVPMIQRESARVDEEKARLAIEVAKLALGTKDLELRAERQLLELERDDKRATLDQLQSEMSKATLLAPTDGVALVRKNHGGQDWAAGTRPWGGTPLVEIPDLARMRVVALAPEEDGAVLEVGQRAVVTLDAYPALGATGAVESVSSVPVPVPGTETNLYEVEVAVDDTESHMLPGMTARVDVDVARVEDLPVVSLAALFHDEEGPFVWELFLGRWTQTHVEVVAHSASHAAVEGLDDGATVALVDPTAWELDGRRPAARP